MSLLWKVNSAKKKANLANELKVYDKVLDPNEKIYYEVYSVKENQLQRHFDGAGVDLVIRTIVFMSLESYLSISCAI